MPETAIILLLCSGTITFQWSGEKAYTTSNYQETVTIDLQHGWVQGGSGGIINRDLTDDSKIVWKTHTGGYGQIDRITGKINSYGPPKDGYILSAPIYELKCIRKERIF